MCEAQNCEMTFRLYDSLELCVSNPGTAFTAVGTIYSDGEGRKIETSTSKDDPNFEKLPGNYRSVCTSDGLVQFVDNCSFTSILNLTSCDKNYTTAAYLYSESVDPKYVLSRSDYTHCYNAWDSMNASFTFAIYGDCSALECKGEVATTPSPSFVTLPTATTSKMPETEQPNNNSPTLFHPFMGIMTELTQTSLLQLSSALPSSWYFWVWLLVVFCSNENNNKAILDYQN